MKRTTFLTATALIALTASAGILAAHGGPGGPGGPRGAMLEQMFDTIDADADGAITRSEIDAHRAERFTQADTDGDGRLTEAEMLAAAEAHATERRGARIEARIARLDSDGDGALSLEEMLAGDARMARMFERLDADGDGAITKAEADAMRPRHGGSGGHGGFGPKSQ